MVKRKTNKKGADFGNSYGKLAKKLISFETIGALEGVSSAAFTKKLERRSLTLSQYVANLIKNYGEGFELKMSDSACSSKRKQRIRTIEESIWEVLVEIYEHNPELKSKRGKYNQPKEEG